MCELNTAYFFCHREEQRRGAQTPCVEGSGQIPNGNGDKLVGRTSEVSQIGSIHSIGAVSVQNSTSCLLAQACIPQIVHTS